MSRVKDNIVTSKNIRIGWYSPTAARMGHIYIYILLDSGEEAKCTSITRVYHDKPLWDDIKCLGVVDKYKRTITNQKKSEIDTMPLYECIN